MAFGAKGSDFEPRLYLAFSLLWILPVKRKYMKESDVLWSPIHKNDGHPSPSWSGAYLSSLWTGDPKGLPPSSSM